VCVVLFNVGGECGIYMSPLSVIVFMNLVIDYRDLATDLCVPSQQRSLETSYYKRSTTSGGSVIRTQAILREDAKEQPNQPTTCDGQPTISDNQPTTSVNQPTIHQPGSPVHMPYSADKPKAERLDVLSTTAVQLLPPSKYPT
jgi:hypothetical protein